MNILVVCTGNICRSPMGEVVLRAKLEQAGIDAEVDSVGVSDEEQGRPMDSRAQATLTGAGYDLPHHQARQVSIADLQWADLVLAMTVGHARSLKSVAQEAGIDPSIIHLWREFSDLDFAEGGVYGDGGALDGATKDKSYSNFYSSNGPEDVPDPWYGPASGFQDTLEVVEEGADGIISWMQEKNS